MPGLAVFGCGAGAARLEITDKMLTLKCSWMRWRFPKTSIKNLRRVTSFFSDSISIEHTVPDYSHSISFQVFFYDRLEAELKKRNYVVS